MSVFANLKPLLKSYEGSITRIFIPSEGIFRPRDKFTIQGVDANQNVFKWKGIVKATPFPGLLKLRLKCKKGAPAPFEFIETDTTTDREVITDDDVIELIVTVTIEQTPYSNIPVNATPVPEEPEYPLDPDDL
jgi:hypothetical protein